MRTNNSKVKNVIVSVYFVLIVMAILSATIFSAFRHLTSDPLFSFMLIVLAFVVLFFLVHRIAKYFEYDSDGVKVVVINRGLLLSEYLNYRENIMEFDKNKLIAFKFNNYIINKTLDIYVRDRHGAKKKETFNVTLVPRKKRRYIRQSLSKMVKENIN